MVQPILWPTLLQVLGQTQLSPAQSLAQLFGESLVFPQLLQNRFVEEVLDVLVVVVGGGGGGTILICFLD